MFNLVKYEFRKARGLLLILLGVTAVLQAAFEISLATDNETLLVISMAMLASCAFVVSIFVMVRGISSYSNELKSKASYLTFLTPNSTLKIVASKFVYTFANALFAFVVFIVLFTLDFSQMMAYFGEYESMIHLILQAVNSYGIHVQEILYFGLFAVLYAFLMLLSMVAVAYFSFTVSATLFRDKKWSGVPSVVLFILIFYGINWLNGRFTSPLDQMTLIDFDTAGQAVRASVNILREVIVPSLVPPVLISIGVIIASLFSCAYMLEKKVSL